MAVQVERLIATLEARIDKYEKNMAKAAQTTDRQFKRIERRGEQMTKRLIAVTSRGGATLAAALAPAALIASVKNVTSEVANLAAEARQAGVNFEAFQELRYATEKAKVGVNALTDGLKEMALRTDEFVVTGKGPAAEAFARLGLDAAALAEGLQKPDELFETIIGRLSELDRAAQIRISDEIFGGTGGEEFVRLLDQGVDALRRGRQEARDFGLVLSNDVAEKAAEVDRKFALISQRVGTELKTAIVEAADALSVFLDRFREIENRGRSSLEERMAALGMERLEVENKILALKDKQRNVTGVLAALEARQIGGTIAQLESRMQAISAEERQILGRLGELPTPSATTPGATTFTPLPSPSSARPGRPRENAFERDVRSIKDRTAELRAMTSAQGQINPLVDDYGYAIARAEAEQQLLNAAQKAGVEITPQLREQIGALSDQLGKAEAASSKLADAQGAVQEQMRQINAFGRDVLGGVIADMRAGKDAADVLANALNRIADKFIEIGLNAAFPSSGTSGILSGLFGGLIGARANGGPVSAGKPYVVGERGPELLVPSQSGSIVPNMGAVAPRQSQTIGVRVTGVFVDDNGVVAARIDQTVAAAAPRIASAGADKALRSFTGGGAGEKILKNGYGVAPRGRRAS